MRLQQGETTLSPQWERGRIFDHDVCVALHGLVVDASLVVVTDVAVKEERKPRPPGLNTVEMLKVASSALNMGPHHAMKVAEGLYTAGYLSYPRTESSAYPPNFDFKSLVAAQQRHPVWGEYAAALLRDGFSPSRGGTDMGDHPPITPMRCATAHEVGGGDSWRLYDYVTRHFLASLSPDALLQRTSITLDVAGETFRVGGRQMLSPGYTVIMPWRAVEGEELPEFTKGETLPLGPVELYEGETSAPGYLTESELITLMEKHAIGTDASIPTHMCVSPHPAPHFGFRPPTSSRSAPCLAGAGCNVQKEMGRSRTGGCRAERTSASATTCKCTRAAQWCRRRWGSRSSVAINASIRTCACR